ncbi:MAG: glycosyltransferase family 4 protein [Bryobacteraceae bacterium]
MKIGLDATYSLGDHLSGVGVYSREILSGLPAAHPEASYLFCYRPNRFLRAMREQRAPRSLLWKDWPRSVDLFHALNQRVDSARFPRTVTTFHDLFVMTGEYSTPEFRRRFAKQAQLAAGRSDLIIAVSQFTADQVHELLNVERARLRVIPHGSAPSRSRLGLRSRPGLQVCERLILFVGAIQKRKNVAALVRAFGQVEPGWRLVLAGSSGYGAPEIVEAVERSPRSSDIELPGYVSDDELERLYARASVFAFPSLDEGFGIPVLEAMSRGVPVLTSNGSALREVAGDAALLVNPREPEEIAAGLKRLTEDPQLRQTLAAKGRARSAEFTWDRAIESTWSVYTELMRQ